MRKYPRNPPGNRPARRIREDDMPIKGGGGTSNWKGDREMLKEKWEKREREK